MKADYPIGIFDSGIGGLTVAKAIVEALPNESVIYFGDTAHLPYGDKSSITVCGYTKRIVEFLLAKKVKLILIACNSASAAAYEMLQNYIGNKALLIDVIDPVIQFLGENYAKKSVGLIATKLTVESTVYQDKISKLNLQIDLHALATPLLVPIIEEGLFDHKLMDVALSEYLTHPMLQNIEALVLACTHYPVVKNRISNFYQDKVKIIDASRIVASQVKATLYANKLLAASSPERHFYVSDYTENFAHRARLFFGEEVKVQELNIF